MGEQDKNKLKQISGVEYYREHIHPNQQRRLQKYIRDAGGQSLKSKRFIPLTDVAKPSMQGRVKMYMQKLTEEEERKQLRLNRAIAANDNNMAADHGQKSQSMLG